MSNPLDLTLSVQEKKQPLFALSVENPDNPGNNPVDGGDRAPGILRIEKMGNDESSHQLYFVTPRGYVRKITLSDKEKQKELGEHLSRLSDNFPDAVRIDITNLIVHEEDHSYPIESSDVGELTLFINTLEKELKPLHLGHTIDRKIGFKGNASGTVALSQRDKNRAPDDRIAQLPSSDKEIEELLAELVLAELINENTQSKVKKQFFFSRILQKGLISILEKKQRALADIQERRPEEERGLRQLTSLIEKLQNMDTFAITWALLNHIDIDQENPLEELQEIKKELLEYIEKRESNRTRWKGLRTDYSITPQEENYATDVVAMGIRKNLNNNLSKDQVWVEETKLYQEFIGQNGGSYKKDPIEEHLIRAMEKLIHGMDDPDSNQEPDFSFLGTFGVDSQSIETELDNLVDYLQTRIDFDPESSLDGQLEGIDFSNTLFDDARSLFREEE